MGNMGAKLHRILRMTPLKRWLDEQGRKQKWLAAETGANLTTVSQWVRGKSRPDARYREAIERITDGGVPVSAWK